MPSLILKKADGSVVRQWDVPAGSISVGRGEQADIQVDDPKMSRVHFVIAPKGGSYVIQDQKSTNGTFVNDQPVTEFGLKPNDKIRAGDSYFSFVEGLGTIIRQLEAEDRRYGTYVQKLADEGKS
ncbi:MAG: FHA domain-containing protein [Verrucomicrobia bacterium]|nr:FHA domain-containing protein [Verrucomicrobiota bacterium]